MQLNEKFQNASLMVRSFTIYKFLTMLSTPFTSMDAYKKGFIDSQGNFIKKLDDVLDKARIDPLDVLIIKLKKLLAKVPEPGIRSSLNNNLAILDLFLNEMYQYGVLPHESLYLLELHNLQNYETSLLDCLVEDMSAGGGGIAGVGVSASNPQDVVVPRRHGMPVGCECCGDEDKDIQILRRHKIKKKQACSLGVVSESGPTQDWMPWEGGGGGTIQPLPLYPQTNQALEIIPYDDWYQDENGDGRPDIPGDLDGDGINDAVDGPDWDMNGNGIPDHLEDDYPDIDTDEDGIPNSFDNDIDGDQIPNDRDKDDDGDGIPDTVDAYPDYPSGFGDAIEYVPIPFPLNRIWGVRPYR